MSLETHPFDAAGLGRESLYKSLSGNGTPKFSTVLRGVKALGVKLSVEPGT